MFVYVSVYYMTYHGTDVSIASPGISRCYLCDGILTCKYIKMSTKVKGTQQAT